MPRKPSPKKSPKRTKAASDGIAPTVMVSAEPKGRGRPTKYDQSFCARVIDLGAQGKSKAQIAADLCVTRETVDIWAKTHRDFSDAIKAAYDLSLAWWENAGQFNMTRQGFNATAFIFQMKNRFRDDYKDASVVEQIHRRDVSELSDAELAAIARGSSGRAAPEKTIAARPSGLH